MLEKKCILLLYGEGRYDSSIIALKERIEQSKDAYVVAYSDAQLYSFRRYRMGFYMYKVSNRCMPFVNRTVTCMSNLCNKNRIRKSKKSIKPYREPKNAFEEYFYSMADRYRQLHNVLARFTPDIVVCTTPKLLRDVIKIKHKGQFAGMSVAGLMTDYTLDKRFINHKVNYYFVQNQDVKDRLVTLGIDEKKVNVVGTVLPKASTTVHNREQVLAEIGIKNDLPNIVLVGGRYGGDTLKNAFTGVVNVGLKANIIVLVNGNEGLMKYCTMVARAKKVQEQVYLIEEIDDFSKMYDVADVMVAEPTAYITYEALYHGVKLVLCKGESKLEDRNLDYLVSNGVGLLGRKNYELKENINKCLNDNEFCVELENNRQDFISIADESKFGEILRLIADRNYTKKLERKEKLQLTNKVEESQQKEE